jgi:DNA-binding Lrp family transcriptional regulator
MVGAYILIKTEPGHAGGVVKGLVGLENIKSVKAVTGPYDVIVYVEGEELGDLGKLVTGTIQTTPGVKETLTCLAVDL